MSRSLRPEDRKAVDLLLDTPHSPVGFAADTSVDPARLSAVSALLHLLDELPVDQPSDDLVARTLNRVAADQNEPALTMPGFGPFLSGQQAHA